MSQDTFELLKTMDVKKIELQLSLQCAPVLSGLKASNLFVISNQMAGAVLDLFRNTKYRIRVIGQNDERTTFLLYREEELYTYLNLPEVRKILKEYGYQKSSQEEILNEFSNRYMKYLQGKEPFPHEMGLFLEYPVEDVLGFIQHGGQNSLYTGYWKVYSDLQEKISLFEQFNQAKERLIYLVYHRQFTLQQAF
ncbi:MAG: DUF3793 family protein [Anaerostipes sp.]|nr:DUF3793 family protein [Anaerostipes sp.]